MDVQREFQARVQHIEPTLVKLGRLVEREKPRPASHSPRPELPFLSIDREKVESILAFALLSGVYDKAAAEKELVVPAGFKKRRDESGREYVAPVFVAPFKLKRRAQNIEALLEDEDLPQPWHRTLQSWLTQTQDWLAQALIRRKLTRELKKRTSAKCLPVSTAISLLASYFFQCHPLQVAGTSAARLYAIIGEIIEQVSTPSCLVCGRPHRFSGPRAVRARDHYKDATPQQRQKQTADVFEALFPRRKPPR